ncbi:hypothetical protein N0V90_012724 [Kalmusia sp. IMI 367209]|nr:hypothetical protein N0V90_012724 [Kalmusia sp. IMI 367209]
MSVSAADLKYQQEHIHDNVQPNIYAACSVCLPAAFLAVGLRLFSRRMTTVGFGKDDLAIIIALFFTSVFVATCIWGMVICILLFAQRPVNHWGVVTVLGMGKQQILQNPNNTVIYVKMTMVAMILYNPAIFFTKLSILLMYQRLFPMKIFHRICWAVGAFILAYSITSPMVTLLQCVPISANWDRKAAARAKCVDFASELIALSTINAVTDFVLLILPMPILWRLHVSLNKKIRLMVMFGLGNNSFGLMWSVVETCLAIVSACLPTLRPLYQKIFGATGDTTADSSGSRMVYKDGSSGGFEMHAIGSKTYGDRNPGRSGVPVKHVKEEGGGHPFTRLEDDTGATP